jgi:hypothetical protein
MIEFSDVIIFRCTKASTVSQNYTLGQEMSGVDK